MPFSGSSLPRVYRDWQVAALPRINDLARFLGVHFGTKRNWRNSKSDANKWYREGQRDQILFGKMRFIDARRTVGQPRKVGEISREQATVQEWDNRENETDASVSLSYTRRTSRSLTSARSETFGWSITTTVGGQFGTESNFGKFEVSAAFSGAVSSEKAEESVTENEVEIDSDFTVPAGKQLRVVQMVDSGEIEIPYTDELLLDVEFQIVDWGKGMKRPYLWENADWRGWGKTRSTRLMHVRSFLDLEDILSGRSNRYPMIQRDLRPDIGDPWIWLANPDNRRVVVKSTARYKQGLWGDVKAEVR